MNTIKKVKTIKNILNKNIFITDIFTISITAFVLQFL